MTRRWAIGVLGLLGACSSGTSGSQDTTIPVAVAASAVPTTAPAAPDSTLPATTEQATTTTADPTTTAAAAAPAADGSWLYPYDTIEPGQRRELPYLATDGRVYATGASVPILSVTALRGLGWADLRETVDGGDVVAIANAAGSARIDDPTVEGGDLSAMPLVDDTLLDWFTVRPFVSASERTPVEFGGFVGESVDYTIGPLDGIGTPCADPSMLCASVVTFGPYLRAFVEGEQGTLWDLHAGGTHLFAVTLTADGDQLVRSLTYEAAPDLFAADSIAFPLVAGGELTAGQTYSVPDMVDGYDVAVTPPAPGVTPHVSLGWLGLFDEANATSRIAFFRADRMYWNPSPSTEPQYPIDADTLASLTPVSATTLDTLDDLVGSAATVSNAAAITVSGFQGVRFTLTLAGPTFECSGTCVAPIVAGFGRSPYVDDSGPRTFVILDVAGSPLLITANGDVGDSLLATVEVRPSA